MSNKQIRLISAVKDAMERRGVNGAELARHLGVTNSMVSIALAGKSSLREERWKMACEYLNIDYDDIVNDLPGVSQDSEEDNDGKHAMANDIPSQLATSAETEKLRSDNMILAAYAKKHLSEDIKNGMDIGIWDLRILLNACAEYFQDNPA